MRGPKNGPPDPTSSQKVENPDENISLEKREAELEEGQ